jgi:hypothetical protein
MKMVVEDVTRGYNRDISFVARRRKSTFEYLRINRIVCVLSLRFYRENETKRHELLRPTCKQRKIPCTKTTCEIYRRQFLSDRPVELPKTIQLSMKNSELIREKFRRIN